MVPDSIIAAELTSVIVLLANIAAELTLNPPSSIAAELTLVPPSNIASELTLIIVLLATLRQR